MKAPTAYPVLFFQLLCKGEFFVVRSNTIEPICHNHFTILPVIHMLCFVFLVVFVNISNFNLFFSSVDGCSMEHDGPLSLLARFGASSELGLSCVDVVGDGFLFSLVGFFALGFDLTFFLSGDFTHSICVRTLSTSWTNNLIGRFSRKSLTWRFRKVIAGSSEGLSRTNMLHRVNAISTLHPASKSS